MTPDVLTPLITANLAAAAAVAAVMVLRQPAARLFGARVRYSLWILVPVTAAAALLPGGLIARAARAPLPFSLPASAANTEDVIYFVTQSRTAVGLPVLPIAIAALWLIGAAIALGLLIHRQRQFTLQADTGELGPAVVGFVAPRIHLPRDFATAFTPAEQEVILAHEQVHLRRRDAQINGVVAVLQCLNWFNPALHLGAYFMRQDQETACDEAVLAKRPNARAAYARAMLKTQLAPSPVPLGCYWPSRAKSSLEERIAMLKMKTPGPVRALAGAAAVALVTSGAGFAAWAATPADTAPEMMRFELEAPAPQQDSLAGLSREVSGVLEDGLLLVEQANGVSSTRALHIGEDYRDGWTLDAVTATSATLKKGAQTHTITFEARAEAAAAAATPVMAANVSLSNSGGVLAMPGGPDRARIQAAIAAGDAKQVMALGGSAADVAAILAARGGPMADMIGSADSINFVNANGRTGVQVSSNVDGNQRNMIIVPPELQDVVPPADAAPMPQMPAGAQGVRIGAPAGGGGGGDVMIRQTVPFPAQ